MKSDTLPQDPQTPSPSRSRRQFLVSDPQSAWIVKSGFVDVFVMSVRSEDPDGVPRHLGRLKENDVLFGVDMAARQLALVGASAPSTVITRTTVDEVLASDNGVELLERWVDALLQPIIGTAESRVVQRIQPDGEIRADEEDLGVAAETGLVWAETIAGIAYCSGHPELELTPASPSFPIGRKSCLELSRGGAIRGRNTAALRDSGELPSSLAQCGDFLAQALLAERERFAEMDAKRLATRAEADEHVFRNALAVLSSPLSRVAELPAADGGSVAEHPTFTACRIVGRQLGIAMKNHPDLRPGAGISNPIEGIAKASSARTRKVLLRGRWWRADHGPLVAFWEHSGEAVALLRKNGRGYVAVDPATGKSQPVTAKVAALLAPFANTFYTPLPPRPLNGWDLAHFSFQVCRRELSIISAMGIGMGLLALLPPYLTGVVLDEIVPSARHSELLNVVLFLFVSMFTTALFTLVRSFATLRMQTKLDSSLQAAVWDRLLSLPAQFFRRFTAGDLAQRSMGINAIRQALTGSLLFSIFSGVFSAVSLGLLFYYDWRLAFAGLGLILVAFLFSVGCGYAQVKQERQVQRLKGAISGMVLQFISGVSKLRVSATEKRAFAVWAKAFGEQRRTAMKARRAANWVAVFNPVYPVFCAMVFYGYESYLSSEGGTGLSTGEFLAFMATFTQFLTAVLTLSAAFISALGIVPLYERAVPILAAIPEVDPAKSDPGPLTGAIELNQIQFSYVAGGPLTLQDVSISIRPGQFVALVGPSGSGKSTLLRLLLGFETPESGSIYFDGKDLSTLDVQLVRQQMGVVLQGGVLMRGSVHMNIIGSLPLSIDDAWKAARMAAVDRDIREMPMGMHTVVSEGGGGLSGGQRQRLMIARAMVRNPRMLLFDEATSALDNETQAVVNSSLESLQTTRIVVAHRLSTIQKADCIYVLDKGRVVQAGNFEELMAQEGIFRDMAKRQIV